MLKARRSDAAMRLGLSLVCWAWLGVAQTPDSFGDFRFVVPKGWKVAKTATAMTLSREIGSTYVNSHLLVPRASGAAHAAEFEADWRIHAAKHGLAKPETKKSETRDGWEITTGGGKATFQNQPFLVFVITRSGQGITSTWVHYFNDPAFGEEIGALNASVVWSGRAAVAPSSVPVSGAGSGTGMLMTKFNTNFDDGWRATVKPDWVEVTKGTTEVRLYYVNEAREKRRPNTVAPPEFYWAQIVEPEFRASNLQTFAGVTYPPVYFMQGTAQDKRTGRSCQVAIKIVYNGGARVVMAITPNQGAMQQQFPHPNDMDRMLNYNKFSLTAKDVVGTWVKSGGGGADYYNAYTGGYVGTAAISSTDEFTFNADGSYSSTHRSASSSVGGGTRFNGLDYKGRATVSDWEVLATNRVEGKTKKFWARLEAIQNGYLLVLTDSDYEPLQYVLFRQR
jgi:hypothetical protein